MAEEPSDVPPNDYWPSLRSPEASTSPLRRAVRLPRRAAAGLRLRGARLERRMVWIFGSPRSGSTWLFRMLREAPTVVPVHEPMIGAHLGVFVAGVVGVRPDVEQPDHLRLVTARAGRPHYFFSDAYREAWQPALRGLLLKRLSSQTRDSARLFNVADPIVVIKEPNGSEGADVIVSALPRTRMILLLRDGRDVVDSQLDAVSPGGWLARAGYELHGERDAARLELIRSYAHAWVARTDAVLRAYEMLPPDRRILLRYEELLNEPTTGISALSDALGLGLDAASVADIVAAHSFEATERKGSGEHVRAASPGLWRENLSAAERHEMDAILGPTLRRLGYDG